MAKLKILIASHSKLAADHISWCLADHAEFRVSTRIIVNGHADPLHGVSETPDMLLLHYSPGHGQLEYLAANKQGDQLPLIVCGPSDDRENQHEQHGGALWRFPSQIARAMKRANPR